VEGLVTEVIETCDRLRKLEVPADLPKAKQKSQAKNFLQQKRKALSDLFRVLQQIGLSYRTGLAYWHTEGVGMQEFTLPPVDLRAAFQHLKNRYALSAGMDMATLQLDGRAVCTEMRSWLDI
jgi:midasin